MKPSSSSSSSSSNIHRKRIPPPAKIGGVKTQIHRNPLQALNGVTSIGSTCSSNASSTEAPKGCLRFFLSSHSCSSCSSKAHFYGPKSVTRTPKSAPNVRLLKSSKCKPRKENSVNCTVLENSVSQKDKKKPPCLYQWNSGKKVGSRNAQKLKVISNVVNKLESGSEKLQQKEQHCLVRMIGDANESNDADFTPLCKLVTGSGLDSNRVLGDNSNSNTANITKTPPIQASVSPEIQCGSSVLSKSTTTPACYGAGHVLSGVTDKRKCRPRGILTVGDGVLSFGKTGFLNSFDEDSEIDALGVANNPSVSQVPLAAEASMHWLLSPCDEENEDQKREAGNDLLQSPKSSDSSIFQSPLDLHHHLFFSDACNKRDRITPTINSTLSRSPFLVSPTGLPELQEILGPLYDRVADLSSSSATRSERDVNLKEERDYCCNMASENSPLSMHSLGSENVMKTPESYSSSDRHVNLSWLSAENNKKHNLYSELDTKNVLRMSSLSPKSRISMWEPASLSFQFDCLTTTPSTSIDLTEFRKVLDNKTSWISSSTLENVSQSQMRISWRDGLASRIFEMDESDCCRCLSDEDEDTNECSNHKLKSDQSPGLNVDLGDAPILINDFIDNRQELDGNFKENLHPKVPSSCAESISTDGGGLTTSGDSDWTLCYKNQLFDV